MEIDVYQVDAFTDRPFAGNPAAVVPLTEWLPDDRLAEIARENNLSETAYFVTDDDRIELRWFTPAVEVQLCGHATLAAAHIWATKLAPERSEIRFQSRWSGELLVSWRDGRYTLDFPAHVVAEIEPPAELEAALGIAPKAVLAGPTTPKWLVVVDDEAAVRAVRPDMNALAALPCQGVIVTAPGDAVDFVSRFFAPKVGVPEDPVTGSAHCVLTPYWAGRLDRGGSSMSARQVSARGGTLECRWAEDRVLLTGQAVTVMRGKLMF